MQQAFVMLCFLVQQYKADGCINNINWPYKLKTNYEEILPDLSFLVLAATPAAAIACLVISFLKKHPNKPIIKEWKF